MRNTKEFINAMIHSDNLANYHYGTEKAEEVLKLRSRINKNAIAIESGVSNADAFADKINNDIKALEAMHDEVFGGMDYETFTVTMEKIISENIRRELAAA